MTILCDRNVAIFNYSCLHKTCPKLPATSNQQRKIENLTLWYVFIFVMFVMQIMHSSVNYKSNAQYSNENAIIRHQYLFNNHQIVWFFGTKLNDHFFAVDGIKFPFRWNIDQRISNKFFFWNQKQYDNHFIATKKILQ